jgi:peptidyl-prolyl cis-trans isomerase D
MMRQMRENTKWIMLITALAFVGLMVFEWGMDFSGRSSAQASGGEIARVNGQTITLEEYQAVRQTLYEQQQARMGGVIPPAVLRQIDDAAFEQVVMQRLVQQELRRRGIDVTNAEIRQAARFQPPPEFMDDELFMTEGQFDLTKYHQFLSSPAIDTRLLLQLENYYRDIIPRTKLYYQTTAGLFVTDGELWRMYRDANETATVQFVAIDPAAIVAEGDVTVTDAEVQAHYRARRDQLQREARASVRFVAIDKEPMPADTAAARRRAERVREEIAQGADFGEVARRESADTITALQDGQLSITRGQTVPAFDEVAFTQPLNRVSEPVLSQFGFHIIRVDSRTAETADVRHILIPIERTRASEDALLAAADSIERLGERVSLQAAAQAFNLNVRTAEIGEQLPFLPNVGIAEEGADWAFRDAELGEVSPVFENEGAFYMLELVGRAEAGTIPLAEAGPAIRMTLLAQKRLERAADLTRQALLNAPAGQGLEHVAQTFNVPVGSEGPFTRGDFVPGIGRLNAAVGAAFGTPEGSLSGVVTADEQVFLLRVVQRTEADRAEWEAQREQQRSGVTGALAEQRWNQFLQALRETATVLDFRAQLLGRRGSGGVANR